MTFKPAGYSSVSPYLVVPDAQGLIDFLAAVFDAQPLRMIPRDDGKLRHAEVRIDDTVVMIADALAGWPPQPANVHVYVADADAAFARALRAGASAVQEPSRRDDGEKRGGFRDAGGTTWWVSQVD